MAKIIVGMSGGVDSAVAAYLLKEQGHEVEGVTLRTWQNDDGSESRCCEIDDARETARQLGIPYHTLNCTAPFRQHVVRPFVQDYLDGLTPNPCIECNRRVKWDWMLYMAGVLQADGIATGHYASVVRLENGRYTVKRARSENKDQTYMLYRLTQEQLSRTRMPLGDYTKEEVRAIAGRTGLTVAQKKDSQEICFVPDGHYSEFIAAHAEGPVPGEGDFLDEAGRPVGRHRGIIRYTVGQRKGLGLAFGHPVFVKELRARTNEVVIADEDALFTSEVRCDRLNFLSIPEPASGETFRARVKSRYHHAGEEAEVRKTGEDEACIVFDRPVRAAAPGQSAVFYDADGCVIGGGRIVRAGQDTG